LPLPTAHDPRAARLPPAARAFRAAHAAIAAAMLGALGWLWICALTGRRGRALRLAGGTLVAEGVLVAANRGDCPLGPVQARLGDPVPLFELVLSPRAARLAVPALGAATAAALAVVAVRDRAAA
jgi:hypothetical protein